MIIVLAGGVVVVVTGCGGVMAKRLSPLVTCILQENQVEVCAPSDMMFDTSRVFVVHKFLIAEYKRLRQRRRGTKTQTKATSQNNTVAGACTSYEHDSRKRQPPRVILIVFERSAAVHAWPLLANVRM